MSPSAAKRLAASVSTDRFAWQAGDELPPTTPTETLFATGSVGPVAVMPAMRDLPSPSAERLHAIERDAFAKGYGQGERAGDKASAARVEAIVQRFSKTIDEIASLRSGVMRRAERELVRLALAMAERILRREIDADPELLLAMGRVAVERLGDHAVATIHLNPSDYEAAAVRRTPDAGKAVELVADPDVPRGGCLVKSAFGTVDASIDAQIRELSRALLGDDGVEAEEAADADVGHS